MRRSHLVSILSFVLAGCVAPPVPASHGSGGPPSVVPLASAANTFGTGLVADVPTYRGNAARNGMMPGPGPIADAHLRWKLTADGPIRSTPVVAAGVVYVAAGSGSLYALDLATGAQRWAFGAGGAVTRSPAVDGGLVYVGAAGGTFSAVDAASGPRRWQKALGPGQIASPAVVDDLVVAASGLDDSTAPHILFALGAARGDERWRFSAPSGRLLVIGALGDGLVFAASGDHNLYAVDAGTGVLKWTFDGHGPLGSVDALAGEVLYVSGGDRAVYAVDAHTGVQIWRKTVTGQPGAIAVVRDRVYIGTDLGRVVAIGGGH